MGEGYERRGERMTVIFVLDTNRPFAVYDHMVQKPPCWRANYPLGHPKQKNIKVKLLCFGCPSGQFALQHGGFRTM